MKGKLYLRIKSVTFKLFILHFPCSMMRMYIISALLCPVIAMSQSSAADSSMRAAAIDHARSVYQDFMGTAAPLYTGAQYTEYHQTIQQGHPFFMDTAFLQGSISYDNIRYDRLKLRFDIVQGRLVLNDMSGTFRLSPDNARIDSFSIEGHAFIRLDKNSHTPTLPKSGFYELLYQDNELSLLKKENKSIQEDLKNWAAASIRYILSSVSYYIRKGDTYLPVNRKKQLLDYCNNRKTEIRQYMRKQKLDMRSGKEQTLVSVLRYYQGLH